MRPMIGLDLEAGGRGEQARVREFIPLADEHILPASTRMTSTTLELLDVRRVAAELMASAAASRDSSATRILVDDRDMTVTIVALRRGGAIGEQTAPHSTVIVPIFGRVRFATGNGIVDLTPGRYTFIGRHGCHEIVADEDAALMLVSAKERVGTDIATAA